MAAWPEPARTLVGSGLVQAVIALSVATQVALASPARRERALGDADIALIHLRVHLRVARAIGAITDGAHLARTEELTRVGRMLGGWIRSIRDSSPRTGGGPPATGA